MAFAYLMYQKIRSHRGGGKRLRAIKEFTEFGAGFHIAMRDLEIREPGNHLLDGAAWTHDEYRIRAVLQVVTMRYEPWEVRSSIPTGRRPP
jgi:RecG-like helicase